MPSRLANGLRPTAAQRLPHLCPSLRPAGPPTSGTCFSPACAPHQQHCGNWRGTAGASKAGTGCGTPSCARITAGLGAASKSSSQLEGTAERRAAAGSGAVEAGICPEGPALRPDFQAAVPPVWSPGAAFLATLHVLALNLPGLQGHHSARDGLAAVAHDIYTLLAMAGIRPGRSG